MAGFKVSGPASVMWPVTIRVPTDGGTEDIEVAIRYVLLRRSEARDLERRLDETHGDATAAVAQVDAELRKRVIGWNGFIGADDAPMQFSEEALDAVLDLPYAYSAIRDGLFAASNGALSKN